MPFYGVFPNKPKSGDSKAKKGATKGPSKNADLANLINAHLGLPLRFDAGGVVPGGGVGVSGLAGALTPQDTFTASTAATNNIDYNNLVNSSQQNALQANNTTQNVLSQQQALANLQLQGASGQGPNPVLSALSNATGQNVANQAALMASQRGASSNPGLIARQAAQQGASLQQQAAGQAASLAPQYAQQQQAALGQTLQNMGSTNINSQNANAGLLSTGANANNAQNANTITNTNDAQMINAQTAQANAAAAQKTMAGLESGLGSVMSFVAGGGEIGSPDVPTVKMANGGGVPQAPTTVVPQQPNPFQLMAGAPPAQGQAYGLGSILSGLSGGLHSLFAPAPAQDPAALNAQITNQYANAFGAPGTALGDANTMPASPMAEGGMAKRPSAVQFLIGQHGVQKKLAFGGASSPDKTGGVVPGKAVAKGNNYANDTVPALLSAGEIVLPRSVTQSNDPVKGAADFVRAIQAKKGNRGMRR